MPPKSKKSESASVASPTISTPSKSQSLQWDRVVSDVVSHYVKTTPQRTKLIDMFMAYIAVVGALQFLYCLIAGNFVREPGTCGRAWEWWWGGELTG